MLSFGEQAAGPLHSAAHSAAFGADSVTRHSRQPGTGPGTMRIAGFSGRFLRGGGAALLVLCLAFAGPAEARRLALVIGNDTYKSVEPLHNARQDAKAVSEVLKGVGFEVTLKQDLTLTAMKAALREFKSHVNGGDEVVFYFSGHGVQFDGTNYLVPIDIVPENEQQVADDAVPLQRVLDDLRDQKARFSLAIVDACRDNPFKGAGRAIGGRGLAPVTAANGQMVLYSAGAGQSALDRLGPNDKDPNGVFTRVLIKEMRRPGLPVDRMLKTVRDQVVTLAKGASHEQVPALYDQSIGEFYFQPGAAPARAEAEAPAPRASSAAAAIHVATSGELDQSFWDRIKDSTDPADFTDYSKQFPKGLHAAEASLMARRLSRPATVQPVAATTKPRAVAPAAPVSVSLVGGPFRGYITSSLTPGIRYDGSVTVNSDGSFEYIGANTNRMRGTTVSSDPNNVIGTGVTLLGKQFGHVQNRYPDGSVSTTVTMRGRIANGIYEGQYVDKFQTGQFYFDLNSVR